MVETVILYHRSCMDGSAAALIALERFKGARLVPVQYGEPLPEPLAGKHIVMVDFSYNREVMETLIEEAESFICLDHHKTAEESLRGLPDCEFDMERSAARMAWDKWGKGHPPWWVLYIEDRDLWRWSLGQSKEINASLRSYGLDPDSLRDVLSSEIPIGAHQQMGQAILRYQEQIVEQHVRNATVMRLLGYDVPVVNVTVLFSEIVGRLAEGQPFAAGFFLKNDGERVYQLRSRAPDGLDVGKLAKTVGGGGHRHAAGFSCSTG